MSGLRTGAAFTMANVRVLVRFAMAMLAPIADRSAAAGRQGIRMRSAVRAARRAAGATCGAVSIDGEFGARAACCGQHAREALFGGSGEDRGVRGSQIVPCRGRSLWIEIYEHR